MVNFRYILDPSSAKYICPFCREKRFVRYLDNTTGELLPDHVGWCDRKISCDYRYTPKEYLNALQRPYHPYIIKPLQIPCSDVKFDTIPDKQFFNSFTGCLETNFGLFMIALFGTEITRAVFNKYLIGQSGYDAGKATIFYRIDEHDNVRSGKIMSYDKYTGKRTKSNLTWSHAKIPGYKFQNCFFGQHLIYQQPYKSIAITESEKTAIIASIYMPQYMWIATGGLTGLKLRDPKTIEILNGRKVIMFPDYGMADKNGKSPYNKWCDIAHNISLNIDCDISVSTTLEKAFPSEYRSQDLDLADALITKDPISGLAMYNGKTLLTTVDLSELL